VSEEGAAAVFDLHDRQGCLLCRIASAARRRKGADYVSSAELAFTGFHDLGISDILEFARDNLERLFDAKAGVFDPNLAAIDIALHGIEQKLSGFRWDPDLSEDDVKIRVGPPEVGQ
jgi:hypothetical protein